MCSLSGLGDILQAGECRDAVTGGLQVLQHNDDPHVFYGTLFPRAGTPGLSICHKVILASTGSGWDFLMLRGGSFYPTKILPLGYFSVQIMGFWPHPNTHLITPREDHRKAIPGTLEPPGGIPELLVMQGPLQSQSYVHIRQDWPMGTEKNLPKSVLLEVRSSPPGPHSRSTFNN